MKPITNLVGKRFGRLLVERMAAKRTKSGRVRWDCKCDCGNVKTVCGADLTAGDSASCGCLKRDLLVARNTKHGKTYSREYAVHQGMLKRCYNKNARYYHCWGGRGIKVCRRWRFGISGRSGFEVFYADMGECPSTRHSLDRIDNDGNYEPSNCRWATIREQSANRRTSVMLTVRGVTQTVEDWARSSGLRPNTIRSRLRLGWSPLEAITHKPNSFRHRPNWK